MFPKGIGADIGIASHYRNFAKNGAVFAICTGEAGKLWRDEITADLASRYKDPQMRWFYGLDTGLSSLAIFAALADANVRADCGVSSEGAVPRDAADFGRCFRLVDSMGWRDRLPEVAAKYPGTKWPAIVSGWDEIAALPPGKIHLLLGSI